MVPPGLRRLPIWTPQKTSPPWAPGQFPPWPQPPGGPAVRSPRQDGWRMQERTVEGRSGELGKELMMRIMKGDAAPSLHE